MNSKAIMFSLLFCFGGIFSTNSSAAVVAIASQEGADVVFQFSGTFLTTGMNPLLVTPTTIRAGISPGLGGIGFGSILGADSVHYLLSSAQFPAYGYGVSTIADSASGSVIGLGSSNGVAELVVPVGYLSGGMVSGAMTFRDKDFQSLGLDPGTYVLTWPVDSQTDSFTLTVVPEAHAPCLILLSGLGLLTCRKR